MLPFADDTLLTPPSNTEAERATLGSMCYNGEALDTAAGILRADDFYVDANSIIFRELLAMRQDDVPVDLVTLAERLEKSGRLVDAGGAPYIIQVIESVPNAFHVEYYARIVKEASDSRRFVFAAREAAKEANDGGVIQNVAGRLRDEIDAILEHSAGSDGIDINNALLDLQATIDAGTVPALPTGFVDLDDTLNGGFKPGQLAILAARPSVGKTAFSGNIVLNVARRGDAVLFFSVEQSVAELTLRLLASVAGVPSKSIERGKGDPDTLMNAQNKLATWPLRICDSASMTVQRIAAQARVDKRKRNLKLLTVDYLQLLTPEDSRVVREQQVAQMTRSLKCLAKDLEIPVILLSQLNRGIENRENKRPRLSDLRESGAIEQDADSVMFLDRASTYDLGADATEARVIVAKNRNGQTGDVRLMWDGPVMTFRSAASAYHEPPQF